MDSHHLWGQYDKWTNPSARCNCTTGTRCNLHHSVQFAPLGAICTTRCNLHHSMQFASLGAICTTRCDLHHSVQFAQLKGRWWTNPYVDHSLSHYLWSWWNRIIYKWMPITSEVNDNGQIHIWITEPLSRKTFYVDDGLIHKWIAIITEVYDKWTNPSARCNLHHRH